MDTREEQDLLNEIAVFIEKYENERDTIVKKVIDLRNDFSCQLEFAYSKFEGFKDQIEQQKQELGTLSGVVKSLQNNTGNNSVQITDQSLLEIKNQISAVSEIKNQISAITSKLTGLEQLSAELPLLNNKVRNLSAKIDNDSTEYLTKEKFLEHIESNNKNFNLAFDQLRSGKKESSLKETTLQYQLKHIEQSLASEKSYRSGHNKEINELKNLNKEVNDLRSQIHYFQFLSIVSIVAIIMGVLFFFSNYKRPKDISPTQSTVDSASIVKDSLSVSQNIVPSANTPESSREIPGIKSSVSSPDKYGIVKGKTWVSDPKMYRDTESQIEYQFYDNKNGQLLPYQLQANQKIRQWTHQMDIETDLSKEYFEAQLKAFLDQNLTDERSYGSWTTQISIDERFSQFITVIESEYIQYNGAAHGMMDDIYYNFRRNDGSMLRLNNIISDTVAFNRIAERYFRRDNNIPEHRLLNSTGFWFPDNKFACSNNFCFDESYMHFVYNPYKIGSFAMGIIRFKVPLYEILHLLTISVDFRI